MRHGKFDTINPNFEEIQAFSHLSRKSRNAADIRCESKSDRGVTASPQLRTSMPASSMSERVMHDCRSAQSLASVGLEKFKFSELHAMIQGNPGVEKDGFYRGDFPVPESFQGESFHG